MSKTKNQLSRFPEWGPYSKKYMGISHIIHSCTRPGVRFDFTTVPAIAALDIHLPNVTLPTGWHPWSVSPDGRQYTYRVDLEWKDQVYADVSYTLLDTHSVLVRTELVNHSDLNQNLMINHFASIEYPQTEYTDPLLPDNAVWIDALDYEEYEYSSPRPWDRQNSDGHKKGEVVDDRFTGGHGLGDRADKWHLPQLPFGTFGAEKGDHVSYIFSLKEPLSDAVLTIRYRSSHIVYEKSARMEHSVHYEEAKDAAVFILNGTWRIVFPVSHDLTLLRIPLGSLAKGDHILDFVSEGQGGIEFDFLVIAASDSEVKVVSSDPKLVPDITETECTDGALVRLSYPDTKETYFLRSFHADTRFRTIETGSLEDAMASRLSNPDPTFDDVLDPFTHSFRRKHSDEGFFHNTLVHTLFLAPGEKRIEYAVVSNRPIDEKPLSQYEDLYLAAYPNDLPFSAAGQPYAFSVGLLQAAVRTNIVFPIRKDGNYILHHTPGKRWDSLYTWDSGFIGLGLLEEDLAGADYILDTYTCEPGKKDYAFLHHGSPVPVQMYLFYEMLQRTHEKRPFLEKYYPRLKYYYEFLIGRGSGSTTARYQSGLTSTYDYFYSSSGMDDYPAQSHMIADGLQRSAAPAISSSQAIRSAKILRTAAKLLSLNEDVEVYDADITRLTTALHTYAWDPEAGYFSYVLHDENAKPVGIYRTPDGENLDKGLDGIYPLIAGVCNEEQEKAILRHLTSKEEMLCPYGISAVDQSAGYFRVNGYWNGNVWFPHQWFIWKTLLDLGETEFAHTVASLALSVWKKEVDATHYTFEMVSVVTGRGGWFHNFGGLSTPISLWASAYYRPGTVNVGFDTLLLSQKWNEDYTSLAADYETDGTHEKSAMLIVMADKGSYQVHIDGNPVSHYARYTGMLEVPIGSAAGIHRLTVSRADAC